MASGGTSREHILFMMETVVEHPPVFLLLFLSLVDGDRGEGAMGVSSDTHLSKKFKMFEEYFGIIFKIHLRTSNET